MDIKITPSRISGSVSAPPSKSYTHRAIVIASLVNGKSSIINPLISDDTKYTIEACRKLGAKISKKKDILTIHGVDGHFPKKNGKIAIYCGNSGTTLRLVTALASLTSSEVSIDGERRLRERPIIELIEALILLGIEIDIPNKSSLPIIIKGGKIKGGKITISGEHSSQFISALLLIAPYAENDTTIIVSKLRSKPYVDITIDLMKAFGVKVNVNGNSYFVKSGQNYKAKTYTVEGDYSAASYFFAANALGCAIKINGLRPRPQQADSRFLDILKKIPGTIDMADSPDVVPSLAIVAAYKQGKTTITNIGHLRGKETDRISALANELAKMGIVVEEKQDSIAIIGGEPIGATIETYNDHRIAMSFAVAALAARGESTIKNAEVVSKSYPNFWRDLQKSGVKLTYLNM